jgi:anti-sigma factor RsiW
VELTPHGTEDQLEDYALGRLPDTQLALLEEHLLICETCLHRLEELDNLVHDLRGLSKSTPARRPFPFRDWIQGIGLRAQPAFAPAFAALVIVVVGAGVFFATGRNRLAPMASLQLTATRGEMATAPAARETDLTLLDAQLAGGPFLVELVNALGDRQWIAMANIAPGGVSVKVQRHLLPGNYFVRVYGPGHQILHEYGFRVRE